MPAPSPSRGLFWPAALFIAAYFLTFSYNGLFATFTFDDGMNLLAMHHFWDVPLWKNVQECLTVFTNANRPLGALFYRPLYGLFGFNPLPFRLVIYAIMIFNIWLAYRFARQLGANGEAAAISTLLFCYNASWIDLYYNSGTIYDLLCFALYIGALLIYMRSPGVRSMAIVLVLYLASLDAKEMALLLPVSLALYELLYRTPVPRWRAAAFIGVTAIIAAVFLKVKAAGYAANSFYRPNPSPGYVMKGIGHYFEQLFYLKDGSFGAWHAAAAIAVLLGLSLAARSRAAIYGTLFFVAGLIPVSVIPYRSGYAAYVAYPGLTVALGVILSSGREALMRAIHKERLERASAAVLFVVVAAVSVKSFAHERKILMGNALWSNERVMSLLRGFQRQIPEFPPDARVLLAEDPWPSDWGQMFLVRLLYHDGAIWLDRTANGNADPRETYDLVASFDQPLTAIEPTRLFGIRMGWEVRARVVREGTLTLTAPTPDRARREVGISPASVTAGQPVTITVPELAKVKIDAVYRIVSPHVAKGWCTLDDKGTCTVTAPESGTMAVDWVRRQNERWIFTSQSLR